MYPEKFSCSSATLPALLNVAELLGEITSNFNLLPEISRILVALLPLERATFAVVRRIDSESIRVLISSGYEVGEDAQGRPAAAPMTPTEAAANCSAQATAEGEGVNGPRSLRSLAGTASVGHAHGPVEMVRQIDAQHQLVLTLHWDKRVADISVDFAAMFDTICDTLATALHTLLAWWEQPALLGPRFARITGMQWTILRALCSDLSEKELAESLKVSPHTLHSHIKRIYQKLGVRGRLQVVQVFQQAVRRFRAQIMQRSLHGAGVVNEAIPAATLCIPAGRPFPKEALSRGIWLAPNCLKSCATA